MCVRDGGGLTARGRAPGVPGCSMSHEDSSRISSAQCRHEDGSRCSKDPPTHPPTHPPDRPSWCGSSATTSHSSPLCRPSTTRITCRQAAQAGRQGGTTGVTRGSRRAPLPSSATRPRPRARQAAAAAKLRAGRRSRGPLARCSSSASSDCCLRPRQAGRPASRHAAPPHSSPSQGAPPPSAAPPASHPRACCCAAHPGCPHTQGRAGHGSPLRQARGQAGTGMRAWHARWATGGQQVCDRRQGLGRAGFRWRKE